MRSFPATRRLSLRTMAVALALACVATAAAPSVIRIRRGDTLSELARRYGTTVQALQELNGLDGSHLIYEGRTLRVRGVPAAAPKAAPVRRDVRHVVRRRRVADQDRRQVPGVPGGGRPP